MRALHPLVGGIHAIGDYSKRKGRRQDFSPFSTKFFLDFWLFCWFVRFLRNSVILQRIRRCHSLFIFSCLSTALFPEKHLQTVEQANQIAVVLMSPAMDKSKLYIVFSKWSCCIDQIII